MAAGDRMQGLEAGTQPAPDSAQPGMQQAHSGTQTDPEQHGQAVAGAFQPPEAAAAFEPVDPAEEARWLDRLKRRPQAVAPDPQRLPRPGSAPDHAMRRQAFAGSPVKDHLAQDRPRRPERAQA